jgi:hypothetical protein
LRILLFLALAMTATAVQAAVVEDKDRFGNVDGRGPLDERAEQLGLSAADADRLRAATGYIVCPGTASSNGIIASAALVESTQVILTVGHAFVDEAGRARAPLEACIFRNQATPPTEVRLAGSDAVWIGLKGPAVPHDPRDYAVALLSRPVAGAVPLRLRSGPAAVGDRGVGIVAWQQIEGVEGDPVRPSSRTARSAISIRRKARCRPTISPTATSGRSGPVATC